MPAVTGPSRAHSLWGASSSSARPRRTPRPSRAASPRAGLSSAPRGWPCRARSGTARRSRSRAAPPASRPRASRR
eukprot:4481735-Prymnesium_polylepis.1